MVGISMNKLFADLFGFFLNIIHLGFIILMFLWFFQGVGDKVVPAGTVIVYGVVGIISYVVFMGALTTLVSIRENLKEINAKLSKDSLHALTERKEPEFK